MGKIARIALIQQICINDISVNQKKGMNAVREASKHGAHIICFAELAFEPFYPQNPSKDNNLQLAESVPGPTTDAFSKLAKELGVVIILNLFEKDGEKTFDTSPVISTNGDILGKTRMIHITDYDCYHEKGYYFPGDKGVPVYNTPFGKIGISICYDRHFPEYMRALALVGAEIVFIPQAGAIDEWPDGLFEAEMRVAAFQNGYFTALCNRIGKEQMLTFSGESFVCDPSGRVIARAGQGTEEILYCDCDLDMVNESHARRLFFPDRRPELYGTWFV